FDLWNHSRMDVGISQIKRSNCRTCGEVPVFPSLSTEGQTKLTALCGRNTVQVVPDRKRTITFDDAEKAGKLANAVVRRTPYFVELLLSEYRLILFENGRLLIHGLHDIQQGRKLYHRLFG